MPGYQITAALSVIPSANHVIFILLGPLKEICVTCTWAWPTVPGWYFESVPSGDANEDRSDPKEKKKKNEVHCFVRFALWAVIQPLTLLIRFIWVEGTDAIHGKVDEDVALDVREGLRDTRHQRHGQAALSLERHAT